MNGLPKPNGSTHLLEQQRSLQSDIAFLQSLLSQDEPDGSDPDVVELLRRLESADGIATGVEGRLDDIIGSLDNLLGALENGGGTPETGTTTPGGTSVVQEEQAPVTSQGCGTESDHAEDKEKP